MKSTQYISYNMSWLANPVSAYMCDEINIVYNNIPPTTLVIGLFERIQKDWNK